MVRNVWQIIPFGDQSSEADIQEVMLSSSLPQLAYCCRQFLTQNEPLPLLLSTEDWAEQQRGREKRHENSLK